MKAHRPANERAPEPGPGTQLGAALFVTALVLALDLGLGVGALRQLLTYRYVPCEARIVSSEVISGTEDTYGVAVDYTYLVDGQLFHGTHYAADDRSMTSGDWARRVVERLPPGTQTIAYHAPDVPERAVLRRGLSGGDLLSLLFLVPFNLLAAGLWWGWSLSQRARETGVPSTNPGMSPKLLALTMIGISPLPVTAAAFIGWGSSPPLTVAAGAYLAVVLAGALAYVLARRRWRRR
jgi:Protein of unknown function (DUF3592)